MNILFLHGKLSTPETSHSALAIKTYFSAKGMTVFVPDYKPNDSSKQEIEQFLSSYINDNNILADDATIIGISLGGYWALNIANKKYREMPLDDFNCVLLNPALDYYDDAIYPVNDLPVTCFLNEDDELLDNHKTYNYLKSRCDCRLFKTGGHRMYNINELLPEIEKAVNRFNPSGLAND